MGTTVKLQIGSHDQRLVSIPRPLAKALGLDSQGMELEWEVEDSETLKLKKKN